MSSKSIAKPSMIVRNGPQKLISKTLMGSPTSDAKFKSRSVVPSSEKSCETFATPTKVTSSKAVKSVAKSDAMTVDKTECTSSASIPSTNKKDRKEVISKAQNAKLNSVSRHTEATSVKLKTLTSPQTVKRKNGKAGNFGTNKKSTSASGFKVASVQNMTTVKSRSSTPSSVASVELKSSNCFSEDISVEQEHGQTNCVNLGQKTTDSTVRDKEKPVAKRNQTRHSSKSDMSSKRKINVDSGVSQKTSTKDTKVLNDSVLNGKSSRSSTPGSVTSSTTESMSSSTASSDSQFLCMKKLMEQGKTKSIHLEKRKDKSISQSEKLDSTERTASKTPPKPNGSKSFSTTTRKLPSLLDKSKKLSSEKSKISLNEKAQLETTSQSGITRQDGVNKSEIPLLSSKLDSQKGINIDHINNGTKESPCAKRRTPAVTSKATKLSSDDSKMKSKLIAQNRTCSPKLRSPKINRQTNCVVKENKDKPQSFRAVHSNKSQDSITISNEAETSRLKIKTITKVKDVKSDLQNAQKDIEKASCDSKIVSSCAINNIKLKDCSTRLGSTKSIQKINHSRSNLESDRKVSKEAKTNTITELTVNSKPVVSKREQQCSPSFDPKKVTLSKNQTNSPTAKPKITQAAKSVTDRLSKVSKSKTSTNGGNIDSSVQLMPSSATEKQIYGFTEQKRNKVKTDKTKIKSTCSTHLADATKDVGCSTLSNDSNIPLENNKVCIKSNAEGIKEREANEKKGTVGNTPQEHFHQIASEPLHLSKMEQQKSDFENDKLADDKSAAREEDTCISCQKHIQCCSARELHSGVKTSNLSADLSNMSDLGNALLTEKDALPCVCAETMSVSEGCLERCHSKQKLDINDSTIFCNSNELCDSDTILTSRGFINYCETAVPNACDHVDKNCEIVCERINLISANESSFGSEQNLPNAGSKTNCNIIKELLHSNYVTEKDNGLIEGSVSFPRLAESIPITGSELSTHSRIGDTNLKPSLTCPNKDLEQSQIKNIDTIFSSTPKHKRFIESMDINDSLPNKHLPCDAIPGASQGISDTDLIYRENLEIKTNSLQTNNKCILSQANCISCKCFPDKCYCTTERGENKSSIFKADRNLAGNRLSVTCVEECSDENLSSDAITWQIENNKHFEKTVEMDGIIPGNGDIPHLTSENKTHNKMQHDLFCDKVSNAKYTQISTDTAEFCDTNDEKQDIKISQQDERIKWNNRDKEITRHDADALEQMPSRDLDQRYFIPGTSDISRSVLHNFSKGEQFTEKDSVVKHAHREEECCVHSSWLEDVHQISAVNNDFEVRESIKTCLVENAAENLCDTSSVECFVNSTCINSDTSNVRQSDEREYILELVQSHAIMADEKDSNDGFTNNDTSVSCVKAISMDIIESNLCVPYEVCTELELPLPDQVLVNECLETCETQVMCHIYDLLHVRENDQVQVGPELIDIIQFSDTPSVVPTTSFAEFEMSQLSTIQNDLSEESLGQNILNVINQQGESNLTNLPDDQHNACAVDTVFRFSVVSGADDGVPSYMGDFKMSTFEEKTLYNRIQSCSLPCLSQIDSSNRKRSNSVDTVGLMFKRGSSTFHDEHALDSDECLSGTAELTSSNLNSLNSYIPSLKELCNCCIQNEQTKLNVDVSTLSFKYTTDMSPECRQNSSDFVPMSSAANERKLSITDTCSSSSSFDLSVIANNDMSMSKYGFEVSNLKVCQDENICTSNEDHLLPIKQIKCVESDIHMQPCSEAAENTQNSCNSGYHIYSYNSSSETPDLPDNSDRCYYNYSQVGSIVESAQNTRNSSVQVANNENGELISEMRINDNTTLRQNGSSTDICQGQLTHEHEMDLLEMRESSKEMAFSLSQNDEIKESGYFSTEQSQESISMTENKDLKCLSDSMQDIFASQRMSPEHSLSFQTDISQNENQTEPCQNEPDVQIQYINNRLSSTCGHLSDDQVTPNFEATDGTFLVCKYLSSNETQLNDVSNNSDICHNCFWLLNEKERSDTSNESIWKESDKNHIFHTETQETISVNLTRDALHHEQAVCGQSNQIKVDKNAEDLKENSIFTDKKYGLSYSHGINRCQECFADLHTSEEIYTHGQCIKLKNLLNSSGGLCVYQPYGDQMFDLSSENITTEEISCSEASSQTSNVCCNSSQKIHEISDVNTSLGKRSDLISKENFESKQEQNIAETRFSKRNDNGSSQQNSYLKNSAFSISNGRNCETFFAPNLDLPENNTSVSDRKAVENYLANSKRTDTCETFSNKTSDTDLEGKTQTCGVFSDIHETNQCNFVSSKLFSEKSFSKVSILQGDSNRYQDNSKIIREGNQCDKFDLDTDLLNETGVHLNISDCTDVSSAPTFCSSEQQIPVISAIELTKITTEPSVKKLQGCHCCFDTNLPEAPTTDNKLTTNLIEQYNNKEIGHAVSPKRGEERNCICTEECDSTLESEKKRCTDSCGAITNKVPSAIISEGGESLCDVIFDEDVYLSETCDNFVDAEDSLFDSDTEIQSKGDCSCLNQNRNSVLYTGSEASTSIDSFKDAIESLDDTEYDDDETACQYMSPLTDACTLEIQEDIFYPYNIDYSDANICVFCQSESCFCLQEKLPKLKLLACKSVLFSDQIRDAISEESQDTGLDIFPFFKQGNIEVGSWQNSQTKSTLLSCSNTESFKKSENTCTPDNPYLEFAISSNADNSPQKHTYKCRSQDSLCESNVRIIKNNIGSSKQFEDPPSQIDQTIDSVSGISIKTPWNCSNMSGVQDCKDVLSDHKSNNVNKEVVRDRSRFQITRNRARTKYEEVMNDKVKTAGRSLSLNSRQKNNTRVLNSINILESKVTAEKQATSLTAIGNKIETAVTIRNERRRLRQIYKEAMPADSDNFLSLNVSPTNSSEVESTQTSDALQNVTSDLPEPGFGGCIETQSNDPPTNDRTAASRCDKIQIQQTPSQQSNSQLHPSGNTEDPSHDNSQQCSKCDTEYKASIQIGIRETLHVDSKVSPKIFAHNFLKGDNQIRSKHAIDRTSRTDLKVISSSKNNHDCSLAEPQAPTPATTSTISGTDSRSISQSDISIHLQNKSEDTLHTDICEINVIEPQEYVTADICEINVIEPQEYVTADICNVSELDSRVSQNSSQDLLVSANREYPENTTQASSIIDNYEFPVSNRQEWSGNCTNKCSGNENKASSNIDTNELSTDCCQESLLNDTHDCLETDCQVPEHIQPGEILNTDNQSLPVINTHESAETRFQGLSIIDTRATSNAEKQEAFPVTGTQSECPVSSMIDTRDTLNALNQVLSLTDSHNALEYQVSSLIDNHETSDTGDQIVSVIDTHECSETVLQDSSLKNDTRETSNTVTEIQPVTETQKSSEAESQISSLIYTRETSDAVNKILSLNNNHDCSKPGSQLSLQKNTCDTSDSVNQVISVVDTCESTEAISQIVTDARENSLDQALPVTDIHEFAKARSEVSFPTDTTEYSKNECKISSPIDNREKFESCGYLSLIIDTRESSDNPAISLTNTCERSETGCQAALSIDFPESPENEQQTSPLIDSCESSITKLHDLPKIYICESANSDVYKISISNGVSATFSDSNETCQSAKNVDSEILNVKLNQNKELIHSSSENIPVISSQHQDTDLCMQALSVFKDNAGESLQLNKNCLLNSEHRLSNKTYRELHYDLNSQDVNFDTEILICDEGRRENVAIKNFDYSNQKDIKSTSQNSELVSIQNALNILPQTENTNKQHDVSNCEHVDDDCLFIVDVVDSNIENLTQKELNNGLQVKQNDSIPGQSHRTDILVREETKHFSNFETDNQFESKESTKVDHNDSIFTSTIDVDNSSNIAKEITVPKTTAKKEFGYLETSETETLKDLSLGYSHNTINSENSVEIRSFSSTCDVDVLSISHDDLHCEIKNNEVEIKTDQTSDYSCSADICSKESFNYSKGDICLTSKCSQNKDNVDISQSSSVVSDTKCVAADISKVNTPQQSVSETERENNMRQISCVSDLPAVNTSNADTEICEDPNISVALALRREKEKIVESKLSSDGKCSNRSFRRATTAVILQNRERQFESQTDGSGIESSLDTSHSTFKKSKSFPIEKLPEFKTPESNTIVKDNDQPNDLGNIAINKKVSDICKAFIEKTKTSVAEKQSLQKLSPVVSPLPQRKLMNWVCKEGKWGREPMPFQNTSDLDKTGSYVNIASSPIKDEKEKHEETSQLTPQERHIHHNSNKYGDFQNFETVKADKENNDIRMTVPKLYVNAQSADVISGNPEDSCGEQNENNDTFLEYSETQNSGSHVYNVDKNSCENLISNPDIIKQSSQNSVSSKQKAGDPLTSSCASYNYEKIKRDFNSRNTDDILLLIMGEDIEYMDGVNPAEIDTEHSCTDTYDVENETKHIKENESVCTTSAHEDIQTESNSNMRDITNIISFTKNNKIIGPETIVDNESRNTTNTVLEDTMLYEKPHEHDEVVQTTKPSSNRIDSPIGAKGLFQPYSLAKYCSKSLTQPTNRESSISKHGYSECKSSVQTASGPVIVMPSKACNRTKTDVKIGHIEHESVTLGDNNANIRESKICLQEGKVTEKNTVLQREIDDKVGKCVSDEAVCPTVTNHLTLDQNDNENKHVDISHSTDYHDNNSYRVKKKPYVPLPTKLSYGYNQQNTNSNNNGSEKSAYLDKISNPEPRSNKTVTQETNMGILNTTDQNLPKRIPKLKAVKIKEEEIYEGKPEYTKKCNLNPLGIDIDEITNNLNKLTEETKNLDDNSCNNSHFEISQGPIELSSKLYVPEKTQLSKLIKKSKTFSALRDVHHRYEKNKSDFLEHTINLESTDKTSNQSVCKIPKRHADKTSVSGLKGKIELNDSEKNAKTSNQPHATPGMTAYNADCRSTRKLTRTISLPDNQLRYGKNTDNRKTAKLNCDNIVSGTGLHSVSKVDMTKSQIPKSKDNGEQTKGRPCERSKSLQRPKLLSEIVEVEESRDDLLQTQSNKGPSTSRSGPALEPRFKRPVVRRTDKRRSLSLPTGTLAFGEARIVYKNGHFTIETMDGTELESSGLTNQQSCYNSNQEQSANQKHRGNQMPARMLPEPHSGLRREITTERPQLRRQVGKTVLNKNELLENGELFNSNIENVSPNQKRYQNNMTLPRMCSKERRGDVSFVSQNSSYQSLNETDENVSFVEQMELDHETESLGEMPVRYHSSSSLPDATNEEVKRVAQRARRTSSFRQAQEQGAYRLSGIQEDKDHEISRRRTVSLDESQNTDLNQSRVSQSSNQNTSFFQRMMAKRKSSTENFNLSGFAKQSESAKDFFAKKMSLKGLFRKNRSDSSVSSPFKTQLSASPPVAVFNRDEDRDSLGSAPSSPFTKKDMRRRHTSADLFSKAFKEATPSSQPNSIYSTPTREKGPVLRSNSVTTGMESNFIVRTDNVSPMRASSSSSVARLATPEVDDDQISIKSTSSATSSVHSVQSQPLEQPNKPKTPKPVGTSPRRIPSGSSQSSQSSRIFMYRDRDTTMSVTSLESETSEIIFEDDSDFKCECENLTPTLSRARKNSNTSLQQRCELCGKYTAEFIDDPRKLRKFTIGPENLEDHGRLPKDSLGRLALLVQTDISASNSNDSGIQHDVSVHSSSESLKGTPEAKLRFRQQKSTSPRPERPKSEIGVRWADLDTQEYDVVSTPIRRRERSQNIKDRPRPKSDFDGSSFLSDRMKAFGSDINLQPYCSLRNLYEMRKRDWENNHGKNRRMSTPHPIKSRLQRTPKRLQKQAPLVRSSSMPESLDKVHKRRKLHHLLDFHEASLSKHMDLDECLSDDSDLSFDHISLQEKSLSVQSSHSQLTSMDEEEDNLTYAEALWDHITMDPEELGFRAGDLINVFDMSDKDWWFGEIEDREGWFPAAFVRLRVNQDQLEDELEVTLQAELSTSPKLRRISTINKDQARTNVVNEIISAEREYVKHLKDVVEGYIQHARKRHEMFPEERLALIFGNIESIYTFAQKFLAQLEMCIDVCPHLSEIGECFLDYEKGFEIYSDYCNNHPSASEELKELYRNAKYRHFFEACRLLQELVEIPLEGFLLTPVQKICKYPLQLAELLKYTPPDHADYPKVKAALYEMRKIATLINERKRKMESIEKIAAWQHTVADWEGEDLLERSSELIFSGDINKINSAGWSQERYFFLFDHQLIYCKKEILKRHVFSYKGRIDLDQCDIIHVPDGKDAQYNATVKHGWKLHETHRDKWYLLYTKTNTAKDRWLKALADERKRVREDQENDFCVPEHWKQTVLNKVRSQSTLKEKHHSHHRPVPDSHLMLQKDLTSVPYATLPRVRRTTSQKHEKKKGWFNFGGKKSKR